MDTESLSTLIAHKVVADTSFWIAVVGLVGVIVGSLLTIIGNLVLHWFQDKPRRRAEEARKNLLLQMLKDDRFPDHWRKLSTLARVIGTDEETAKNLLVLIRARGSENDDGLWGLIEFHPFEKTDQ